MVHHVPLTLVPARFPVVAVGQKLTSILPTCLKNNGMKLHRGDVIAVASKIVSTCEARVVRLQDVRVSSSAKRIARKWRMDQRLATIVLNEADQVLGGVNGFLLTIKNGILTPNAGVDLKNSPSGCVTLWPRKPDRSANRVRGFLNRKFHCRIGVVLVDSRVTPLRLGTTGLAIGVSGFMPVEDYRRQVDLFGRRVHVTRMAVADDLASAAHLLMGESDEGIGLVLIRNAPIVMDMRGSSTRARLGARRCLIASNFRT